MKEALRVLIVEDSKTDAALLLLEFKWSRFQVSHRVVKTEIEFRNSLFTETWDLVVSDFVLPRFSALQALRVLKESGLDIPFIIVSGLIGEETAVDALKSGAHDFFFKGKFQRFLPAIERELAEAKNRKDKHLIEATLYRAVADLEEERQVREGFVAGLTHDLKTPLAGSSLALQFVLRQMGTQDRHRVALDRVARDLRRLDRMINDLPDANLLRAGGSLPIEPIELNLNELIIDVFKNLYQHDDKRFVLEATRPFLLCGDPEAIRRILENLLVNAVKYGAPDSVITVTLAETAETLEIRVHNFGKEIPLCDQDTLFDPFRRTSSATKGKAKGWGIGLALVRGYAKAHGGGIQVASSEKDGTTFMLSLSKSIRPKEALTG